MSTNHLKFRSSGLAGKSRLQPPCQSVFTFIWAQIEEKEQMQCIGTRNNYMHAFRRFKEFRSNEDLPFSQMTPDLMEQYRAWLLNRGLKQNTVAYYLRTLRTLYRRAAETGIAPDCDIFARLSCGSVRTHKRAITMEGIRLIEKLKLPKGSSLDLARDLFLFSFYMRGMSFVDMAYLKKSDLKHGMVSYTRRKTHQHLTVEWEKPMQNLVGKYAYRTQDSIYMLPILSGKDPNPYVRYKQVEQNVNRNLKKIGGMIGLKMPLTTYVARHTWASIALCMDIPLATISEGMGHQSYKTTQIYLDTLDTAAVNQANKKILKRVLEF